MPRFRVDWSRAEQDPPRKGPRLALVGLLAALALTIAAIPVWHARSGPTASAATAAGAHHGVHGATTPAASAPSSAPPAPPLQVPTRVAPVPPPAGPIPFAQYQEMHASCTVTAHRSDDPIVFPGQPGVSHNHTFAGNTATDASSTAATLLPGKTSCQDTADTSAYWFPTLYQSGALRDPSSATMS